MNFQDIPDSFLLLHKSTQIADWVYAVSLYVPAEARAGSGKHV